ncbi:DUF2690 domain-containing protein [Nonomuraea longispora]|uniref:DUF2690 domain-containing protein n=1 Tax=Nonomuraea longispora TaxID=1848320 RepID=A0A4V2XKJ1_9ACTN|nr:DUF2690 domain-containing protein [Nonomuraea longispora]
MFFTRRSRFTVKLRVVAVVTGAVTAAALFAGSPANAQAKPYDHQDPYKSGCGNSARVVKSAKIKSRANGTVGTIKLMWSGKCKTNWTEIKVGTTMSGTISVYARDGRSDSFTYKAGNGGRHWGDMIWANNMCAWGSASVKWGGGRGGQNGSGTTGQACR